MSGRRLYQSLRIFFILFSVWGSLAQIAPDVFQVKREQMTGWMNLVSPNVGWILFPLAALALITYIDLRFRNLESRLKNEVSARMPSPTPDPTTAIPQAQLFQSQGFSWELTHNFWPVVRSFAAEDNYNSTGIIGPLCPQCRVDVSDDLRAHTGACHECRVALHSAVPIQAENRPGIISSANSDPLWPLRKAAFRDAQRALRRGDITAP